MNPCRMSLRDASFPFRLTRAHVRVKKRKPDMLRHATWWTVVAKLSAQCEQGGSS